MIYLTNKNKHYFAISNDAWLCFNSDYLLRAGCDIHATKEEMYTHLVNKYGYSLDQLEGNEISIFLNDKNELVESIGVNMLSFVAEEAEDYDDWLVTFSL